MSKIGEQFPLSPKKILKRTIGPTVLLAIPLLVLPIFLVMALAAGSSGAAPRGVGPRG